MSTSGSPPATPLIPWCSRALSAISARPVRAAEPRRAMSRDEGGVRRVSASSRVRRTRSRRGPLPAIADELLLREADFAAPLGFGRTANFFLAIGLERFLTIGDGRAVRADLF